MRRLLLLAGIAILVLLGVTSLLGIYLAPRVRVELESVLSARTGRPVRVESFGWSLLPTLRFEGRGLSVGSREEPGSLFVHVDEIVIRPSLTGLLRSPRSIHSIRLSRLLIRIPPRNRRDSSAERPVFFEADPPSDIPEISPFIVNSLILETAAIELISRDPGRAPRVIQIRTMTMRDVALGHSSDFVADLRYPHPEGDVNVEGVFGPFNREDPIRTPISGHYTFKNADLSTFREIGGILTSEGDFKGDLGENHIEGMAVIPDFHLTKAENIVPLKVDFVVDRVGSEVYLRSILSSFLESELSTAGEITRSPEGSGRVLRLKVSGEKARVEDLLRISLKGDEPPLTGQIQLDADVTVPPGTGKVIERLFIEGTFEIHEGEFTDPEFQKKLAQISKLGRADQGSRSDDRTFSDLIGEFRLENSEIDFSKLQFGVPGMKVSLTGSYGLESNEIDFRGRVSLERSVSEMASGRLSDLLKILDPLLRGEDGGTSVPIRIKGDRSSPSVSVDF